jgi:alcohol dehydrogenase class IV
LNYEFSYGPRLIAGVGSSRRVPELLPRGRCLLVTDQQLVSLGLIDGVLRSLHEAGISVEVFDEVEADPSVDTVLRAASAGRGMDSVVGLGGGSPMDVAKLAAYLIGSNERLDDIWGVGKAKGSRLPLVLVPTTAGTGSEATRIAIVNVGGGEKRGVSSVALIGDWAVLDAQLTSGLPRSVTAATGMDAIVHAVEAYTSLHLKNPISDLLAREALRLLAAHLLRACESPDDLEARSAMMLGAHLAGVAFSNAPVGGVHALAYPLGGQFHIPHGVSNALLLPHVLRFNLPNATGAFAELAPLVRPDLQGHTDDSCATEMIDALQELSDAAGLPRRLRDVGIEASDLDMLTSEAMKQDRLLRNNPRHIEATDARALYEQAW